MTDFITTPNLLEAKTFQRRDEAAVAARKTGKRGWMVKTIYIVQIGEDQFLGEIEDESTEPEAI